MRFYFVRHGESEANLLHEFSNTGQKHPLTAKGVRQAVALAEALAAAFAKELSRAILTDPLATPAIRIFSSPLLRAAQTAAVLARALGVDYQICDALVEYSVGIYEGRSDPEGWAVYQQVVDDWFLRGDVHSRMEGGESMADIHARFLPFVKDLLQGPEKMTYILISHGGTYRAALPWLLKNVDRKTVLDLPMPNTGYVLAEKRGEELVCLEWCGVKMEIGD